MTDLERCEKWLAEWHAAHTSDNDTAGDLAGLAAYYSRGAMGGLALWCRYLNMGASIPDCYAAVVLTACRDAIRRTLDRVPGSTTDK